MIARASLFAAIRGKTSITAIPLALSYFNMLKNRLSSYQQLGSLPEILKCEKFPPFSRSTISYRQSKMLCYFMLCDCIRCIDWPRRNAIQSYNDYLILIFDQFTQRPIPLVNSMSLSYLLETDGKQASNLLVC